MAATSVDRKYAFRYGADMDPALVRQWRPDARFVARARLTESATPVPGVGTGHNDTIWGILLTIPAESPAHESSVTVLTDDGRSFNALVLTTDVDLADHAATIAAARYWELPPDYIRQIGGMEEETTA